MNSLTLPCTGRLFRNRFLLTPSQILVMLVLPLFSDCQTEKEARQLTTKIDDRVSSGSQKISVFGKLDFGNGYNSASGREHLSVMASKQSRVLVPGVSGGIKTYLVETKDSLRNILSIDKSFDLKFKIGSFGASLKKTEKMYRETAVSSFKQVMVIKGDYLKEPNVLENPQVKEELIKLAKKDPVKFMLEAGDMFVSKIYTGGELYGVYELQARSNYEKKKNETFVKASASYLSSSVETTQTTTRIKELQRDIKEINSDFFFIGGTKPTPESTDITSFKTYYSSFKEDIATSPAVIYVELTPYEDIAGFPKIDFSPIRVKQKSFFIICQEVLDNIEISLANARFVITSSSDDYFDKYELEKATEISNRYGNYKRELEIIMDKAYRDFRKLDIEKLREIEDGAKRYEPVFDYSNRPYTESFELNVDEKIPVSLGVYKPDDVYSDFYLYLDGELSSSGDDDIETLKPVVFKTEYSRHPKKYSSFISFDVYCGYSNPYYQIIFLDANDRTKVIYDKPWTGEPVRVSNNVEIQIQFKNPNKTYNIKAKKKYSKVSLKGSDFPKKPMYKNPRDQGNPPVAKIYSPGKTKNKDADQRLLKHLEFFEEEKPKQ